MWNIAILLFFQAEDGIRDYKVTGVQTCALPISWLQRGTRLAEAAMAAHDEKEDFAFRASNGFAVMSEGERRIQTQPHLTARLPLHQGRSKFRAGRGLFLPLLPGSE